MFTKYKPRQYKVVASFDTETCNYRKNYDYHAYTILYILNDFRECDLRTYVPDNDNEHIYFDRYLQPFLTRIKEFIEWGKDKDVTPIITAYNLLFDLQTCLAYFNDSYDIVVNAQNGSNVYTFDLYKKHHDKKDVCLLRFWDTYNLETNGLAAMGETAGLAKACGDWNYSLMRTPETPLTDLELFYAKRDVQVIPAYLCYLLQANEWLTPDMLGVNVLTKTSIVRRMAIATFGTIKVGKHKNNLEAIFKNFCKKELPKTYHNYALRKACFRGGFTFTSANFAMQAMKNVCSLDVTSMHHTFINGRYVPYNFIDMPTEKLETWVRLLLAQSKENLLSRYVMPFNFAFHAIVYFEGIKPRKNSLFEKYGIYLAPQGKFAKNGELGEFIQRETNTLADVAIRERGYHDKAINATFAFGKLVKAEKAVMFVNELELWSMSQVYEWESLRVICGEGTIHFMRPPDYITLQSNLLYNRKNDCKHINNTYTGDAYNEDIPKTIPEGIAKELKAGTLNKNFFFFFFQSTVKGSFNAIYGTQAQDEYKPDFMLTDDAKIIADKMTVATPDNFAKRSPRKTKVLFTYGMRIVGGSRMHLVIALELLYDALGDKVKPTGGDTDSIKCACDNDVTDSMLLKALEPIAIASKQAINTGCAFIKREFPQFAADMSKVGSFDIEKCYKDSTRYEYHMEFWNKARVSMSCGEFHITCAGLSRRIGTYHIEHALRDLYACNKDFYKVVTTALGYNVRVCPSISGSKMKTNPSAYSIVNDTFTDYLGNTSKICAPEAKAIYPDDRMLGEPTKSANIFNIAYMKQHNIKVDTSLRELDFNDEGNPTVFDAFDNVLMKGIKQDV